jgi:hypothetical protein
MRFFEFQGDDNAGIDKFVISLRNYIGRAASKRASSTLNWSAVAQIAKDTGFEFLADPNQALSTFKQLSTQYPILQNLVTTADETGITLKVPGAPDDTESPQQTGTGQTSQDVVDQTASSAAAGQLAAANSTPPAPKI